MEGKKRFSVRVMLITMIALPALVISVVLMFYAKYSLTSGLHTEALQGLSMLAQSLKSSYATMTGDWYLDENQQLWKGEGNLNALMDEIDSYVEGSDADVTICYGKTRRLTSLRDSKTGERILGTDISDEVWAAVQRGEK